MGKHEHFYFNESIFDLNKTLYDRFNELLGLATELKNICIKGEQYKRGFTQIAGDIWVSFFVHEPIKKSQLQKATSHYDLIDTLNSLSEFKEWLRYTQLDTLLSVLATIIICEQLVATFEQDEKAKKNAIERNSVERKRDYAANRLLQLDDTHSKFQQQASLHMLKQAEDEIEQKQTENQKIIERFKKRLPTFLQDGQITMLNNKEIISTFCTLDGTKIENVPLKEQFLLAEQLSQQETLIKVAEMAGRFKKIAQKKFKTSSNLTMERKAMTLGNQISNVIPLDLANYILPQSRVDFLKRLAEAQTITFDNRNKQKLGKGPIIICLDESSSMKTIHLESKAFCLALLFLAKRQKRDLAIIPFSSDIGETFYFLKGHASTEKIVAFSNSFLGGGTNFEKPLRKALNILLESKFNNADIIFITDGTSFLSTNFINEFSKIKKKRNFECTSIVLTNLFNAVDLNVVNRFSDHIIEVNDLLEAEEVFTIT